MYGFLVTDSNSNDLTTPPNGIEVYSDSTMAVILNDKNSYYVIKMNFLTG